MKYKSTIKSIFSKNIETFIYLIPSNIDRAKGNKEFNSIFAMI